MSRTRTWSLCVIAALGVVTSIVPSAAVPLVRAEEDPVAAASALADEAAEHFAAAGDTDASHAERKKSRREAYWRLKKARNLLNDHLDAHPDETESLDSLYVRISTMLFWTKKEAGMGELEGAGSGSGGTSGGTKPKPKPGGLRAEPRKKPTPPPPSADRDDPAKSAPTEPEPEPEIPAGPTAADGLAEVQDYERRHPGDVPGLHERYTEFLGAFPDPATDEYENAMTRLEALGRQLKDVYRSLRDEDPDELADLGDAESGRLVTQLIADLAPDNDDVVRERAARYLGSLGTRAAVVALIDLLKAEPDTPMGEACAEALSRVGGRIVCARLARLKRPSAELSNQVVMILSAVVERGGPEGRVAGETMAEFALSRNDESLHTAAVELLRDAGKPGALGLASLLSVAGAADVEAHIVHLGEMGDPRTATHLAAYLKSNARGIDGRRSKAARAAIQKFGKPSVRYLIPALDDADVAVWTAELLRRFTGVKQKNDKRKTWERWYRKNRRDF